MVYNSAVECSFDKREVTGSNPVRPSFSFLSKIKIFIKMIKHLTNSLDFSFVLKLSAVLPKYIESIIFDDSKDFQQISVQLRSQNAVIPVVNFLKNNSNSLFLSIAELTAVD